MPMFFTSRNRKSARVIIAAVLASATAQAAVAQTVPTQVDPAKVESRFDEQPQPMIGTGSELPSIPRPAKPSKASESKKFVLKAVAIDGATVYKEADLRPYFAPYLGKEITLGEANAISDKITARYRADGYILSQAIVPSQGVKDGTLRIRVVEGFVSNVIIQGQEDNVDARGLVRKYGDKIKNVRPLNLKTMERYLLLMDDLPGATAKGIVRPSPDTFGAADLVVTITNKKLEGSLSADNRGSRFIGPLQLSAVASGNSLLGLYERSTLRGITTGDTEELRFFDFQQEHQIGTEGTRVSGAVSYSRTEPGGALESSDIEGRSLSAQGRVSHPFIRSRAENLQGRFVFDYRNTDTDFSGLELTDDRLRVARLGGTYDIADSWLGVNLADAQISRGLNIFGASEDGTNRSRTDATSDFTKLNLDLARTQALPYGFSLFTAASAQYSFSKLLSAEQFSVGGAGFGGAYDSAELSGDHGAAAKAELRYGGSVGKEFFDSYQLFGYYDVGGVWNKGNSSNTKNTLASTGFGARANFVPWLSGSAEVGFPLTKRVSAENDRDPRLFFSLTGRF